MEWGQVIGICSWCFVIGMFVGERAVKRDMRRAIILDEVFTRAVKDSRDFALFAGLQTKGMARVLDEQRQAWIITIEREAA